MTVDQLLDVIKKCDTKIMVEQAAGTQPADY